MQVQQPIASGLDRRPDLLLNSIARTNVQEYRAGIANQPVRPVGYHQRTNGTRERIHPQPSEYLGESQSNDSQYRDSRIRDDVHIGGAHVVVPRVEAMIAVLVLLEFHALLTAR